MKFLCFKVEVKSYLAGTVWSDQLFGHITWAVKSLKGEEFFNQFIDAYKTAKKEAEIPMIFSSIFPHNHLPLPSLSYNLNKLFEDEEGYKKVKKIKKARFVRAEYFSEISNSLTSEIDVEELYENIWLQKHEERDFMHNTIDRESGRVLEGALFVQEQKHFKEPLWFFVKVSQKWEQLLCEALKFIELRGLGADAAIGAGSVKITEESPDFIKDWDYEKNSFISISHAVSRYAINYQTVTKYGKLFNKIDESDNPFKQPIIMMEPGAILGSKAKEDIAYGIIRNIHRNEKIIHCAIPFLVPVNLSQEVK